MPNAPLKPCKVASCPEFRAPDSMYCAAHTPQFAQQEQDRRGTAAQRGYGSRWAKLRAWFLSLHPICAILGCGHAATDVDHKIPVSGPGDPLFWLLSNLQALCHRCHSAKTASENGGFGNERKP